MERTPVQKLARVLRVIVIAMFACNIILLFFVPGFSALMLDGGSRSVLRAILDLFTGGGDLGLESPWLFFAASWGAVWAGEESILTIVLLVSGICTAIILWQAKRVLDSIIMGMPFHRKNSVSMITATICCFVIFVVCAFFGVIGVMFYASIWGGLSYNAANASVMFRVIILGALFLLVGLVFLVMSALFRQAADIKAENDLTI